MANTVITWDQLKEFCNRIPERFLSEPVRWWGDELGGIIGGGMILDEDYVKTDEGWEPKSVQEVTRWTTQEDIDKMETLQAGTPVLQTDF